MRFFVYRNLTRRCLSIRAEAGPFQGRVVAWVEAVQLGHARFVVGKKGRQRVLETGRKNVHAGVVGAVCALEEFQGMPSLTRQAFPKRRSKLDLAEDLFGFEAAHQPLAPRDGLIPVTYNPYRYATFVRRADESPIEEAPLVVVTVEGCFVYERPPP